MVNSFCSFNVKGLANPTKRLQVFNWLKNQKHDIILLQELHCTMADKNRWEKEWGSNIYLSGNSTNSTGVGIFINNNKEVNVIEHKEVISLG